MVEGDCWVWPATDKAGYGKVRGAKQPRAHVLMWTALFGTVPEGLELHHACENKACCNPLHLQALTRRDHKRAHFAHLEHCPHGHAPEDYVRDNRGRRRCMECHRIRNRKAAA